MCGIAGVATSNIDQGIDEPQLRSMLGRIVHRGPDDEGVYLDGFGAIGVRRLSIIDVQGGHQPIHNEDQRLWVVLNGEIYNFKELYDQLSSLGHHFYTRSDTEVIVHAFEEWGDDCVDRLNGMYAFAVWDKEKQRLFIARDRAGIKPLHYCLYNGRLAFASEIKALLALPDIPRELDLVSLNLYLTYEHVPNPRTIFKDIYKLPPGHTLAFQEGQLSIRSYWDFDLSQSEAPSSMRVAEWQESFSGALEQAVRMEMVSDVPLGVFLSGGIDSSAIAAMMTRAGGEVKSFSIAFENPSFDESKYARTVAQHLGTQHHEELLDERRMWELVPRIAEVLDEPLGDSSFIPTYLLSEFARRYVTVALGGDGGDELLAGYSTIQAHKLSQLYLKMPSFLRESVVAPIVGKMPVSDNNISLDFRIKRFVEHAAYPPAERHHRWLGSFTPEEKSLLLTSEVRQQLAQHDTFDIAHELYNSCTARESINKLLYLDMKLYLDTDILTKVDRASMASSLEARVPFLNKVLLDLMARMPLEFKLKGLTRKYILRESMKGILPDEVINRSKKGFNMPVAKWIKGELRGLVQDVLSETKIKREGLFNPVYINKLLDDHLSNKRDNRKLLWTLLVFELWHDRYMA